MKFVTALTFVIAAALACGCEGMNKKASTAKADVLNVSPAPLPPAMPVAAAAPVSDSQPVAFSHPMQSQPTAISEKPAAPKSYTVKKGDTLFSIAKAQLGSGRDWQKIVSVNPGLTPQKLRVGQQIVMPS